MIKDSLSVINTECLKVTDCIASFEETQDRAVKEITFPLVQTLKGFITNVRTVSARSHNKLYHLSLRHSDEIAQAASPKVESLKDSPVASNKNSPKNRGASKINDFDMRQSLHDQQDIEMQLVDISNEMVDGSLTVDFKLFRAKLAETQKNYKRLAHSLTSAEVLAVQPKKDSEVVDYYKEVFQQRIPNSLYALMRLTFMFEGQDPKKLKQKLIELPKNSIEQHARKEIFAELDRDSQFIKNPSFMNETQNQAIPIVAANLAKLGEAYTKNNSLIKDLVYMYIAMKIAKERSEKEDMLSAFSSTWNSSANLSKYSSEIDSNIISFLWQPAQMDAK